MINSISELLVLIGCALAGCAFGAYKYEKSKLQSKIKVVRNIDLEFIKKWIATQDFEKYNKSYTAVLMRGNELPKPSLLKLFFDINKIVALCVYDKDNKSVVNKELFLADNISEEFGNDEFIEFPFE